MQLVRLPKVLKKISFGAKKQQNQAHEELVLGRSVARKKQGG